MNVASRLRMASAPVCLVLTLSACTSLTGAMDVPQTSPSSSAAIPVEGTATPQRGTAEPTAPLSAASSTSNEGSTSVPSLPVTPHPSEGRGQVPQESLAAVLEDLSTRLRVTGEEITVIKADATTWPDRSLGCAQEGMSYLQVVTDGYWIVLGYGEETYDYRVNDQGTFFLCVQSGAAPPGTVEPGLTQLVEMAKEDLAGRLSVSADQIAVLEARSVVWPDTSLGCPKPGMGYLQVLQEGTLIRLGVGPIPYEYHSGEDGDPFYCDQLTPALKGTEPADYPSLPLNPPDD